MPAVWCPYVLGQRKSVRNPSFADVRHTGLTAMERLRQMEGLIGRIESTASPDLRAQVRELVEAILEFHGIGLSRMLELMGETDPALREFSRDPEVSSLLLLHGLHPEGLEIRVKRAVDHMPDVEFIQIFEGRLRLKARSGSVARQ